MAVRGGATILQLREKDIDGGDFAREAAEALKVGRGWGTGHLGNGDTLLLTPGALSSGQGG